MRRKNKGHSLGVWALVIITGCAGPANPVVILPSNEESRVSLTYFGNKYEPENVQAVSYTHLDVYKRQERRTGNYF